MNAVYCSLPVVADDVTGSKEIDVFLSTLLQRTEKGIHFTDLGFMRYAEILYPILEKHMRP